MKLGPGSSNPAASTLSRLGRPLPLISTTVRPSHQAGWGLSVLEVHSLFRPSLRFSTELD